MWGRLKTFVLAAVVGSGGPRAALRRSAIDAGDAPAVGAHAAAVPGHDRGGPREHAGVAGLRDPRVARQPLLPGGPVPAGRRAPMVREEDGRAVLAAAGGAGRGRLRARGRPARGLPAARPPRGRPRAARPRPRSCRSRAGDALKTFTLVPAAEAGWVFGGSTHLDPGAYAASFLLPPGCTLSQVEVAPPCLNPIEPAGGWQPTGVTTSAGPRDHRAQGDRHGARAAPGGDADRDRRGDFQVEAPPRRSRRGRCADAASTPMTLRARPQGPARDRVGRHARGRASTASPAFVTPGAGQRWLVDGCRKAVVCPGPGRRLAADPDPVLRGGAPHADRSRLGDGASLERVRVEKKKSAAGGLRGHAAAARLRPGPRRAGLARHARSTRCASSATRGGA